MNLEGGEGDDENLFGDLVGDEYHYQCKIRTFAW